MADFIIDSEQNEFLNIKILDDQISLQITSIDKEITIILSAELAKVISEDLKKNADEAWQERETISMRQTGG